MLLSPEQIRRLNAFKTRWKSLITIMLQLGNFLMVLTTATPRRPVIAVLASLLQFPGMAFVLASIRINMLRLLLSTYDYWYFTLNNLIFGVCFAAIFRDIRVVTVFMGCVIVQISIGADALVGDRRQLFISSAINCGTHMAMFVAVFLKLVDDKGNGDSFLLSYSSTGYGFSIRDTLMNTQLNIMLLFGRLEYRNWVGMREQEVAKARRINSETSYIPGRRRCVSYYCTVGLRPKTGSSPSSVRETVVQAGNASSIPRTDTVGSTARSRPDSVKSVQALDSYRSHLNLLASMCSNSTKGTNALHNARRTHNRSFTKIQLKFVPIEEDFNAYKTLVPGFGRLLDRVLGSSSSRQGRRVVLNVFHALGYVGMGVLVLGALCAWVSKDQNLDNLRPGLARTQKVAFFASLIFCNVFFAAYQRQLLKRLYSSFNFIFLTTKLTVASMALCQFFAWDRRVIWVWGAWIWMQWAITLDALPPSAMRLLAFRRSTLTLSVLAFELTGLIILSLELFVFDRWIVPNRAVVDRVIRGRRIQLSTLSALVTRLWTIFLWDCKLIWFLTASLRRQRHRRLSVSAATKAHDDDEGERLLLTGRVEFFYEWASETPFRPRWSNRLQILRASQAMLRRYTKTAMTREERGSVQVSKPD
ncbi:hypothetical protein PF010_g1873 [Phytophthora fragariae]|uniref:Uncharacterized protein n=1 Tax=Phytophthora fragariae TaxID=53985 RepID=A0A6G0LZN4_9STRA|nr:hypothetical protein PF010_g1873 [Phytophthora fragariae]